LVFSQTFVSDLTPTYETSTTTFLVLDFGSIVGGGIDCSAGIALWLVPHPNWGGEATPKCKTFVTSI
jgi:hypothetical protein